MTTLELPAPPPSIAPDDLLDLQLKVARRADALALGSDSTRGRDLLLWFQAEREMLPQLAGWSDPSRGAQSAAGTPRSTPVVTEV